MGSIRSGKILSCRRRRLFFLYLVENLFAEFLGCLISGVQLQNHLNLPECLFIPLLLVIGQCKVGMGLLETGIRFKCFLIFFDGAGKVSLQIEDITQVVSDGRILGVAIKRLLVGLSRLRELS